MTQIPCKLSIASTLKTDDKVLEGIENLWNNRHNVKGDFEYKHFENAYEKVTTEFELTKRSNEYLKEEIKEAKSHIKDLEDTKGSLQKRR